MSGLPPTSLLPVRQPLWDEWPPTDEPSTVETKPLWDEWPPTDEPTTVESKPLWDEWSPTDEPTTGEGTSNHDKMKLIGPWPPKSNHDVAFYQYNTTIKTTITVDTVVVEQFLQDIKGTCESIAQVLATCESIPNYSSSKYIPSGANFLMS
ncbi:hypothetical protein GUJ93_ZPchr0004g39244 [Zizania palustris]|uniref:Uncharacterized protein n=1 Tax=Zizania palustris TaxID=103762 RepID=A0A8J5V8D8_ZIZPA|nr:hypothetical protein GUJ93_ZPchr0004g39244 [Zizania palustris]